ncbi:MAG: hypothetical protein ACJ75H_17720 [Thermoanaerobaculia bacterium]
MASTSALRKAPDVIGLDLNALRSLRHCLEEGERPDRAMLIEWGCQLLARLDEAHSRGLACGPLDEDGVIVLPDGRLAITGWVPLGEDYTVRKDLLAVGGLLRRLAFAGAVRSGRGPGFRDPLVKVLARATFADPAAGYGSAAEMAEALREAGGSAARGRPLPPPPAGGARVAALPGPGVRRGVRPAGADPAPPDEDALWRALLLMVASLLLMTLLLVAGGFYLDLRSEAPQKEKTRASSRVSTPPRSPISVSKS